jgi:hypothetical protein
MIVGQEGIVEGVLMCLLGGGHALLEGVPGLGKTMLVRTLAETIHAQFSRVQFTPDLMPADIVGTNVITEDHGVKRFEFQRGPIFANIVLADEINRATPKTQSALLEAMQERAVTIDGHTHALPVPFLIRVFSTLNAPGPYAVFLVFAVLVGLPAPQRWKFLALALGLTALLLTKTRSAWAAFLIGALVLQLRQPLRSLPRQWIALAVVLLIAAPALTHPRIVRAVAGRAASLSAIEDDRSYRERKQITNYVVGRLKHNPIGDGLGRLGGAGKLQTANGRKMSVTALDSGVLEVFSVMGWMGGMLFTFALFGAAIPILRERRARRGLAPRLGRGLGGHAVVQHRPHDHDVVARRHVGGLNGGLRAGNGVQLCERLVDGL